MNSDNSGPAGRPAETELLLDEAQADSPDGQGGEADELPGIGFGDFARMILVLGIVIVLIYGFFWLLKRFSGTKPESEDAIRVLSTRPLKGDSALHLVETGQRLFLIGSSGNSVNLLTEIDDQESIDEIRLEASRSTKTAPGNFARLFRDRFGGGPAASPGTGKTEAPIENSDPTAYLRKQRERLKDL